MPASLPSIKTLFSASVKHIRMYGAQAVVPCILFALVLCGCVVTMLWAIVAYGQFSLPDEQTVQTMLSIVLPALGIFVVTVLFNWIWVVTWARPKVKGQPNMLQLILPLLGMYILYKIVASIPPLLLLNLLPSWQLLLIVCSILWVLFVLSRGIATLLFIVRDRQPVIVAIKKSLAKTKNIWPAVMLRIVVLELIVIVAALLAVGLLFLITLVSYANILVGYVCDAVVIFAFIEVAMLFAMSFALRLGEEIDTVR